MRTDELKKSYEKFGPLYPILTDAEGKTIDGRHRERVDPDWPKIKLDKIKDAVDREIVGLTANITRREICRSEIRSRLGKIARLTGWSPRKIAREVGRSYEWVTKYLPQKFKDSTGPKKRKGNESKDLIAHHTINSPENAPIPIFAENVWFHGGKRENYGSGDFDGNTDPFLIRECLLKYAKPRSLVLDPMAGSGTVLDLCKELHIKNVSFDIRPLRDDIAFGDAEKTGLRNESVGFVFAHFPYWKKIIYSDHPADLSNLNLARFLEKADGIFREMYRVLKPGGYFALLIGDHRHGGGLLDLTAHFSVLGQKHFSLFDKVVFLTRGQKSRAGPFDKKVAEWRAKKGGHHLIGADFLLIFRKEA